ncbi:type II secretion system F family protein [Promicromonospora sp. NFX87]|uniref:type II secretion system F family protein n=1 Tax=Promicromonospora sp. NFX87 TaxID=3402691 RepID=UPI003AFA2522
MSPTIIGMAVAAALAGGGLLLVTGIRQQPADAAPAPGRAAAQALVARLLAATGLSGSDPAIRRRRQFVVGAAIVGLVLALMTGWYILVLVLPAAVLGLPVLIQRAPAANDLQRLTDLDAWVRSLAGILVGGGSGLEQALRASLGSAPSTIRPHLGRLIARLDAQQPIKPALELWAHDMNDHTADIVAMALILESERREGGVGEALAELADSVSNQVKARRQIEADRTGYRVSARIVTAITLVVIGLMIFSGTGIEPYKTPVGQFIALVLLTAITGCLLWIQKLSAGKPIPRLMPDRMGGSR